MLGEADEPADAVAEFEVVLVDYLRVLGSDDPGTLNMRGHLGYWRREAGDLSGGVTSFEQLLNDDVWG